jgi:adenylate kinase
VVLFSTDSPAQAAAFDDLLHAEKLRIDHAIELKVDENILLDRVTTRAQEAKERGEPVRADDNQESLKIRLDAYNRQTAPLIEYYRRKNTLKVIDGLQPVDAVTRDLFKAIEPAR